MVSKFLKRLLPVSALTLAATAALDAGGAQAILVFEFLEQGSDVRLDVSGSLTGLPTPAATSIFFGAFVRPSSPFILSTDYVPTANLYSITDPTSIGTSTATPTLSSYSGAILSFLADPFGTKPLKDKGLYLPNTYSPGNSITGSGLFLGQSFSSLGLNSTTPGALLGSWDIGTDKIEARIAVPGPLPLFGVAAAFAHSRRLRARLRVGSAPQA
ncbi:MAG: hypothetical protein FJ083_15385 [Cyanobacteria bacterium K_Offshore_surface_m2_239]|nr:hypothetical protein [Cyanobacteria bacterium K_Offshore_surface_m2_239]